jgi:hypothetical protein
MVIDRLVVSNLSQNATGLLVSIHFFFKFMKVNMHVFPQDVVGSNDGFSSFCNVGNLKLVVPFVLPLLYVDVMFSETLLLLASQNKILQLN